MKNNILTLLFLLAGIGSNVYGQTAQNETKLLTSKMWTMTEDRMSGMGKHESLPAGTTLQFLSDGTWQTSQAWMGAKKGTWQLKKSKLLVLTFDQKPQSQEVEIVDFDESKLRFRLRKSTAVYTYAWNAK